MAQGLVGDLRGIVSDAVRMIRTRLELLVIEVQEQKALIVRQLVVAVATLFFIAFGMQLLILWLALTLDESRRLVVLGSIGAIFMLAGVAGVFYLLKKAKRPALADMLDVLKKDEEAIRGALAQHQAQAALKGGDD